MMKEPKRMALKVDRILAQVSLFFVLSI